MADYWRGTYAARFVDRITLRPSGLFWPVGPPLLRVTPVQPATPMEAWAEMMGAFLRPSGEDVRRAG